jgi:PhnB protein
MKPAHEQPKLENWKPEGYTSVSPYLIVSEPEVLIAFTEAAFGARELRRFCRPDGSIMHVEMCIDDSVVMIGGGKTPIKTTQSMIHLYVSDVDEIFLKALAAKGKSLENPREQGDDPDKRGMIMDPCGNIWAISTQKGEGPNSKQAT